MSIRQDTYAVPRADLGVPFAQFDLEGNGFIATEVLPVQLVGEEASTISVVTRENMRSVDDQHGNRAAFNRVGTEMEDLAYQCVDRGLEHPLSDRDRAKYASDFDAETVAEQTLRMKLLIAREIRAATLLFNTTTWTGADLYTDDSGAPWDAAGSDALGHILAARRKVRTNSGVEADSMLIGPVTRDNLLGNTVIKAKFPGAVVITEAMMRQALASIVGIQNLYVGMGSYNSADEGQTYSGADIWSDDYALIFRRQSGSLATPGLGRTLVWDEMANGMLTPLMYREEQTESDVIRERFYEIATIFDPYFAHLLKVDA